MSRYEKEKLMKRINVILKSIAWGIIGFGVGIAEIAFCIWVNYVPQTLIGEYCLLFSPVILGTFCFLYTLWSDINLFRKEW